MKGETIMKKIFALLIVCALILGTAYAADIDLSGMTYDELVALKDKINLALWNSDEWQEVTVPIGVWTVGEDIPVGHWTIKCAPNARHCSVYYCDLLDASGKKAGNMFSCKIYYSEWIYPDNSSSEPKAIDLDCIAGTYIIIEDGAAVFTPYTGKPSLGFK